MGKPIEEDLADFLLTMQQHGSLTKAYYRECFRLWREVYGEQVAEKIRSMVKSGWE